ncbi:TonB-dependent receptor [candidate division WOR-3 bacterium]|uniref:TonB-dependent receptor n=1 Tax=candidate division WOR-3 bacterium TaxID=2052148 RepID=A0A938BQG6_UNCW3|nr:TonB-dependent receptor [candidate division WOR-3 bacterium]
MRCPELTGILAGLLLVLNAASAAGYGAISGKVLDANNGEPVAGANVVLEQTELGGATDACGCLEISRVPAGAYSATASAIGYAPVTHRVTVTAGEVAIQDFRLEPAAVPMPGVEVSAPAAEKLLGDRAAAAEVVSSKDIEAKGAVNLQEALKCEAGVRVSSCCPSSNAAEVQIQGLPGKYTQVVIDGLPTVTDLGCNYGLPFVASAEIERLEISKGPGTMQYGSDAFGGVVNVVTKSLARNGGSVVAEVGTFGTMNVSATVGAKIDELEASAVLSKNRTSASDVNGDGISDYAQSDRAAFSAKLRRQFGSRLVVGLGGSYWADERHGGSLDRIAGRAQVGAYENPNLTSWAPAFSLDWQPGSTSSFSGRGTYSNYRQRVFSDEKWFTAYEDVVYGEVQYVQMLPWNQRLAATLSNRYQNLAENTRLGTKSVNNLGLAVEDELSLGRFGIAGRARLDQHSELGPRVTPNGAVVFRPGGGFTLRATYGAGYKAPPSFSKVTHFCLEEGLFTVLQNPDLRPERSRGANLSAEYRSADLSVATSLFRTDIEDMITDSLVSRDSVSGVWRYQHVNRGAVATQGLELSAAFRPARGLSLRLGYQLLDARDKLRRDRLPYRSVHSGNWQAIYAFSRLQLDLVLSGEYVGSMPTQRFDGDSLVAGPASPAYTTWNCRVSKDLGAGYSVFLAANNLLDFVQDDWLAEDVPLWGPSRGRYLMAGLKLTF